MCGKQKIIDEILATARAAAASMVEETTAELNETTETLRSSLEQKLSLAAEQSKKAADDVYAGRVKLGDLEANKIMLAAKQRVVAAVYDEVERKILTAPDAEYLALLQKLIVANCEDGDVVIAAQTDAKRVTDAWVKKVSTAAKKKLALAKERGAFSGGVVLRNAKFDRDLTVSEIVKELKDRTVTVTVEKLGLQ